MSLLLDEYWYSEASIFGSALQEFTIEQGVYPITF
jgi:hypothetical protein